jgi:hypothetical protein
MSEQQPLVLYTYSRCGVSDADRWANTGIADNFFDDAETARQAVFAIRDEVAIDAVDRWSPVNIEKVETHPITRDTLLALLNRGVGAIVRHREIVDIVG